jgi:hypothetical protein
VAEEESTRRPVRRQAPARAAAEASQEAGEAERVADAAVGLAGEAWREAREAELGATVAAQVAVAAAQGVEAEREAAVLTRQILLTPSQLRSLIEAIQAPGNGAPAGNALDPGQQSLALKYDALRTMLGRRGAASIALYHIVDERYIVVDQLLGERSWVVVYGRPANDLDQPIVAIGRAPYEDGGAYIPGLGPNVHIDRVEILDADKKPVLLGRPVGRIRTGRQPHLDQE